MPGPKPTPVIDRLLTRVEIDSNECWIYQGYINKNGYGYITCNPSDGWPSRTATCHSIAYHFLVGPVPPGRELDHLCRVRACCNPEHLEPVTGAENTRRGEAPHIVLGRNNVCAIGHPLTEANTYVNPKTGWRRCRTCRAAYMAAWRAARAA